ncbi:hypothetical protein BC629DRAFT_1439460 [Irpex lacteus]|nr:hypothetical protein BC629DRAFT_1439460 [Irpex lacteus]
MIENQAALWCPVDVGAEVRIQSFLSKKSIDFDFSNNYGSRVLHQFETVKNTNQKWKLQRVDSIGYLIRHVDSGLCLIPTTVGKDGAVNLDVGPFGHAFIFERHQDSSVLIHLAGKEEYTLTIENGSEKTGAKFVLWPHASGAASRWRLTNFHDVIAK